jgi:hypothetical protein
MSFNWKIYIELNPDLIKCGLTTKERAETHYKIHGIKEKRKIYVNQLYPNFKPAVYKNKYPDLNKLSDEQASLHWLKYGRHEKRSYLKPVVKNSLNNEKKSDLKPLVKNSLNTNNISTLNTNYKFKFTCDKTVKSDKLMYKLIFKNNLDISINNYNILVTNNELKYNNCINTNIKINDKNTLIIKKQNDIYHILINNIFLTELQLINSINLNNNNSYNTNIILPVSLNDQQLECRVNFDYILSKYINYVKTNNYQLTVCHTENNNYGCIDKFIIDNDINYIFVVNPFNYNRGYTKNLYKYTNLSKYVLFNDIDIPIELGQIEKMLKKMNSYDIVKPYLNNLYNLTKQDKYIFINKIRNINIKNYKKYTKYTISGGVVLFKESVLKETGGFEEFNCYGFEDRTLDVIILGQKIKYFCFDDIVFHLFHEKGIKKLYEPAENYCINYYGCGIYSGINSIHDQCRHKYHNLNRMINYNKKYNANLNLFKSGYKTINHKILP